MKDSREENAYLMFFLKFCHKYNSEATVSKFPLCYRLMILKNGKSKKTNKKKITVGQNFYWQRCKMRDRKKIKLHKCFGKSGKIQCTTAKQFLSVWPQKKRYAVVKYATEY